MLYFILIYIIKLSAEGVGFSIFFFFNIYLISNLYYLSSFDYLNCFLFKILIIVKLNKFL